MGKKRVVKLSEEQLLKEKERLDKALKKEIKVKKIKGIKRGKIYISSSYNNTILTLTDEKGNVIAWSSTGKVGFKGTKKGSPFAAARATELLVETINKLGLEEIEVFVKGIGVGRQSALRTLATKGVNIVAIEDVTPIPHNGCRPPRPRRV